jgi:hypothetical protein
VDSALTCALANAMSRWISTSVHAGRALCLISPSPSARAYTSSKRLAALPIREANGHSPHGAVLGAFNNLADLTLQIHLAFPKRRSENEPHPIAYFEAVVGWRFLLHFAFTFSSISTMMFTLASSAATPLTARGKILRRTAASGLDTPPSCCHAPKSICGRRHQLLDFQIDQISEVRHFQRYKK